MISPLKITAKHLNSSSHKQAIIFISIHMTAVRMLREENMSITQVCSFFVSRMRQSELYTHSFLLQNHALAKDSNIQSFIQIFNFDSENTYAMINMVLKHLGLRIFTNGNC
jgi:hypothetical protein